MILLKMYVSVSELTVNAYIHIVGFSGSVHIVLHINASLFGYLSPGTFFSTFRTFLHSPFSAVA